MSALEVEPAGAAECPKCGHRAGRPLRAPDAPGLESLILEKICSLEYVSMAEYGEDGREVTIHVIHDYDPERLGEMIRAIGDGGTVIEHEMPDRVIIALAIHDGPDRPDFFLGYKVVYVREAGR